MTGMYPKQEDHTCILLVCTSPNCIPDASTAGKLVLPLLKSDVLHHDVAKVAPELVHGVGMLLGRSGQVVSRVQDGVALRGHKVLPSLFRFTGGETNHVLNPFERTWNGLAAFGTHRIRRVGELRASRAARSDRRY